MSKWVVNNNELKHYASEYYDPVKAHEYYEAHKKLKGRKSTANLNDKGNAAASYVKGRLDDEYNNAKNSAKSDLEAAIRKSESTRDVELEDEQSTRESVFNMAKGKADSLTKAAQATTEKEKKQAKAQYDSEVQQYNTQTKAQISSLQAVIKGMKNLSSDAKAAKRAEIQAQIDQLRADNSSMKEKCKMVYEDAKSKSSEKYSSIREDIKTEYNDTKDYANKNYKEASGKSRSDHKERVTEARNTYNDTVKKAGESRDSKYLDELDKIKSDSSMVKKTKKK